MAIPRQASLASSLRSNGTTINGKSIHSPLTQLRVGVEQEKKDKEEVLVSAFISRKSSPAQATSRGRSCIVSADIIARLTTPYTHLVLLPKPTQCFITT